MNISGMNHISIIVKDVDASRKFYCDVLGFQEVPRPPAFKFAGAWFVKGNAEIHLVQQGDASQPPGDIPAQPTPDKDIARARHHAFTVDDLDSLLERLRQNNIGVVLGPRNRSDGVMQTYVFDPDMHLVEFVVYPADYANR